MDEDHDFLVKILIIGDSGVGKSALLERYSEGQYSDLTPSTVGVDFKIVERRFDVNGEKKKVKIQLWDTAGQERFRSITETYFRGGNGVIIVYDVTKQNTFQSVRSWFNSIRENITEQQKRIPIVLVGNKCDLKNKRKVSKEKGEDLSKILNLPLFFETSAKNDIGVKKCFDETILLAINNENKSNEMEDENNLLRDPIGISLKDEKKPKITDFFSKICSIL